MVEQIDAGPVLKQKVFDLEGDETTFTLNLRCYSLAIDTFEVIQR